MFVLYGLYKQYVSDTSTTSDTNRHVSEKDISRTIEYVCVSPSYNLLYMIQEFRWRFDVKLFCEI